MLVYIVKKIFFSFYYALDSWRIQQIRNMGVVENQKICEPNEWEEVKRKGWANIAKWINDNMQNCDCVIVLIGEQTHTRKWVKYEVKMAKELKKPIFGIFIHKLKDSNGKVSRKGKNIFDITAYQARDYANIKENLELWISENTTNKTLQIVSAIAIVGFVYYYRKVIATKAKGLWNRIFNNENVAQC